ncbi:MAG: DegT/DnrJ/EryC1/StrS family aminotransferase [Planctomycetota bacterium]
MNLTAPHFDDAELALLKQCLDSKWVTQGPLTRRFEENFSQRHNVKFALATTSCTAALHLSTLALRLAPGDEVIVPAFTWVTSAHCAEYVGARAVFADIEPDTFNLDPSSFEAAVTPRTRAVVVVHLFGHAARMNEILTIARKHRIAVIEDAACAIGTTYNNIPVGGLADIGCFSFHPRKIITTGEGGMVTTNRQDLADRVLSLRNHGASGHPGPESGPSKPYTMGKFDQIGFNLRLSDIQAAVGIAQLAKLDGLLSERAHRARIYHSLLKEIPDVRPPLPSPLCGHTYQSYVIRLLAGGKKRRNAIMDKFATAGIQTRPGTHAVHRLGYYRTKYNIHPDNFPNASDAEDLSITLPIFPGMTDGDQDRVISILKAGLALSMI